MSTAAEETRTVDPSHLWTGSLESLWGVLRSRAYKAAGRNAWVILPHGALVALKIREDMRKELRISRDKTPSNERGFKAWENEIATFLKYFTSGIRTDEWMQFGDDDHSKGIARTFVELWPNETKPGTIVCEHCRLEARPDKKLPRYCYNCARGEEGIR